MRQAHPIFSRWGCLSGLLLVTGVGLAIAFSGGSIFNPGELTTYADDAVPAQPVGSHAEIGNDCAQCHAPFAGVTASRCQACHTEVAEQRAAGTGLHGALPLAEAGGCAGCHSDHHGRDFNPSEAALLDFDHTLVGFSLVLHAEDFQGQPMACESCHRQVDFAYEPATCLACHGQVETAFIPDHVAAFGTDCVACHDGVDATHGFDHATTDFPLDGEHAALTCSTCHSPAVPPADTTSQCAGCHAEPPVHAGLFGTDCAACHTTTAWQPAQMAAHAFPLDHGDEGVIACATCHTESFVTYTCTNCHEHEPDEMIEEHAEEGIVGAQLLECAACHPSGEKD
jgi:hypothetical protein